MDTKMMSQFSVMDNEELEIVSGGGNLGSAIGGCIGAVLYSIIIAINLLSYLLTYKISKLSKNDENKIVSKILIILSIVYVIVDALLS